MPEVHPSRRSSWNHKIDMVYEKTLTSLRANSRNPLIVNVNGNSFSPRVSVSGN